MDQHLAIANFVEEVRRVAGDLAPLSSPIAEILELNIGGFANEVSPAAVFNLRAGNLAQAD